MIREAIARMYALHLRACHELDAHVRERFQPWPGRPIGHGANLRADELIALLFARSTKTFQACVGLCESGFGQQAAMLNRSLFEGMVVAHWVHANEDEAAQRFDDAVKYDRHLEAELVERVGLWAGELDEDALAEARLEHDQLKRMSKEFGDRGQYLWTRPSSMYKLVNEIGDQWEDGGEGLRAYYAIAHRDNNQMLHATVRGLSRFLVDRREDGGVFRVGSGLEHIDQALFGAHWCHRQVVTLVMDRFGFPDREGFREAIRMHEYWLDPRGPEDYKDAGRNDPCPCGSGEKYKRCHLEQVELQLQVMREFEERRRA